MIKEKLDKYIILVINNYVSLYVIIMWFLKYLNVVYNILLFIEYYYFNYINVVNLLGEIYIFVKIF